jgi:N-acetylglutamate synthase-like GNAT family acetyltransferase
MDDILLRRATGADWPQIAALLAANRLPLGGAREHLEHFLLAEARGEVVGCAGLERHGQAALLRSVAVAPSRQGQGLGRLLTGLQMDRAQREGLALYLLTTSAAAYFQRFGFCIQERSLVPDRLQSSPEFQGACPASATFMAWVPASRAAEPALAAGSAAVFITADTRAQLAAIAQGPQPSPAECRLIFDDASTAVERLDARTRGIGIDPDVAERPVGSCPR